MPKVLHFPQRRSKNFPFTTDELRNMKGSVYYEGPRRRTQAESNELKRRLVNDLLVRSPRLLETALRMLLSYQTETERKLRAALKRNYKGFSRFDAPTFTTIGEQVETGKRVTQEQSDVLLKVGKTGVGRIAKYWRQIWPAIEEYLNEKEAA